MLGNVNPRALRITSHPVVYSGRDNVTTLMLEVLSGRRYVPLDLSGVTRWTLVFPHLDPQVVIDSTTEAVFDVSGGTLTVDLSGYAMDASIQPCWLIAYDAEHPLGQVLVDDADCAVTFEFREVSGAGLLPLPLAEYVTEAPADGKSYVRKNAAWVEATALVSGVSTVNGFTGDVLLNATNVGADPAGAASAAVAGHLAAGDPHPQYATDTDLSSHVASSTPHAVLTGVDRLAFDQAAAVTVGEGELAWNDLDKTLDLGLPNGSVLQVGHELLVRVLNNTGGALTSGDMVYITGASGQRLTVAKATPAVGARTLAMVTQDIANNQDGLATVTGLVRGFDTSAFADGAELWLHASTPGALTATRPSAPTRQILVGYCVRSHATTGILFVNVRATGSLALDTSDVTITTPAEGQVLVYRGGVWVNEAQTGGSGEANTASNIGTGVGLFAQKVDADLQFKSLIAGANVSLTFNGTSVTIDATTGGESAVSSVNGSTGAVVLDTDDISEGASNLWYTNARAAAAAPVQSVNGLTGAVSLASAYAPLSHVGDTGTAHGNATTSVAGFMSAADKTKLDGIANGATANATDAQLRDRATHTGEQAISTVTGLQSALDKALFAPVVTESGTARISALGDAGSYLRFTASSAKTYTIQPQASVAWVADSEIHGRNAGTSNLTLTPGSGVTLNAPFGGTLVIPTGGSFTLKRAAENVWDVIGQTVAA